MCYACSYASSVGAKHFCTSAKINKGLDELFLDITKRKQGCFIPVYVVVTGLHRV